MAGIKADRELRLYPDYVPEFVNYPIRTRRIPVELSEEEWDGLQQLHQLGLDPTDGEALRCIFPVVPAPSSPDRAAEQSAVGPVNKIDSRQGCTYNAGHRATLASVYSYSQSCQGNATSRER